MKQNKILYIVFALFTLVLFNQCSHDDDFFDGPAIVDLYGEFVLLDSLEISRTTVDFSIGESVVFTAAFNKNVDWIVEITGTESGAVKRIEGFDNELNEDNARWDGGTTELPFFRNELCNVELLIPEADSLSMTGTVEITGLKVYPGNLFTDFETDAGTDIFFGNFEFEFTSATGRTDNGMAAQGDWFYMFEGTDNVVPNFFVGLIDISSTVTGETYAPIPTTVPEELFFNAFVYADGGPHGIAVIQLVYDSNDSGAFEDGTDQTFQLPGDFPLNWVGWKQISFSMSEIGMSEEQVQKIVALRLLLISDMNTQPSPPLPVDYGIDFLTFTSGGPLEL